MIFPIRPAAAARAVLAAVVLVSAGGCTTLGTAPAKAGGPGAQAAPANPANAAAASTMSSQATDPAKPDGGGARRGDTRLVDTPPVEVVPPQVQVRRLDLDRVRQGMQPVPQAFITDLPASLQKIERAGKRKRLFIKTMLPAVLRANAAIKADRDFVKAVIALDIPPGELPDKMRRKLRALAEAYEVDPRQPGGPQAPRGHRPAGSGAGPGGDRDRLGDQPVRPAGQRDLRPAHERSGRSWHGA